jgi:enamine deaminase RidA (YjgF/YER057c/UK114 family)
MIIAPIHHEPMKPEYKSPFSAAMAVEDARLIFVSGCCTIPSYHKHPHDPVEERQWLQGDLREQTERTFEHMKLVLDAAKADFSNVLFLTIYMTDIAGQDIMNEISARHFDPANPPGRTLLQVMALAHPNMMIEIDAIAAIEKGS